MSEQIFTLNNFRKAEEIADWPLGSNRRGTASFTHESNKRGQRIGRQTPDKHGRMCKPKYSTYYQRICLVDGSDGKTHMIGWTGNFLSVMSCDMKHSEFSVWERDAEFKEYKSQLFAATEPEA